MFVHIDELDPKTRARYIEIQNEVYSLICEAGYRIGRLDIERPLGWQDTRFLLQNAWRSAQRASEYWNNGCNYQWLVNAKKELEEAIGK